MASKALFAVQLKSTTGGRVRLGVGHLVDTLSGTDLVQTPMRNLLVNLAEVAETTAKEKANSRGVTRSILTEIDPPLAKVRVPLKYAATLNRGRRKGEKQPSTEQIADWAGEHGWQGRLFTLARHIQKRGLKGRFFMRRARAAVRQEMPRQLEIMEAEIEKRFES